MSALVRRRTSTRVATSVARRTIGGLLRRLPCAIPIAAMLTTMAGSAFAQNCTGVCADEVALMSSFISLPNSAAGLALLNANLLAEESIYLNSTQVQKVTAAANVLLSYMPANVLIGAFPTDPRFQYDAQGFPPTLALPSSINNIVVSLLNVTAMDDLKTVFGQINNYGRTYGIPLSVDPSGDPAPFQASAAIGNHPFTAANSSALAVNVQQTNNLGFGENWQSNLSSSAFQTSPKLHQK